MLAALTVMVEPCGMVQPSASWVLIKVSRVMRSLLRIILHFGGEGGETLFKGSDKGESCAAKVEVSTGDARPAVVDAAGDAELGGWVGEFDIGAEGKGAVCAGESAVVEAFATGGVFAGEFDAAVGDADGFNLRCGYKGF